MRQLLIVLVLLSFNISRAAFELKLNGSKSDSFWQSNLKTASQVIQSPSGKFIAVASNNLFISSLGDSYDFLIRDVKKKEDIIRGRDLFGLLLNVVFNRDESLATALGSSRSSNKLHIVIFNLIKTSILKTISIENQGFLNAFFIPSKPDKESFLAVGYITGRIELRNIQDGQVKKTLENKEPLTGFVVNSDGTRVITTNRKSLGIRVIGIEDGQVESVLPCKEAQEGQDDSSAKIFEGCLQSPQLSPCGKYILAFELLADSNKIHLFNYETKKYMRSFESSGHKKLAALTPDDRHLIFCSPQHNVLVWDIEKDEKLAELKGHGAAITAMVVFKERSLAITSEDETLKFWRLYTGKLHKTVRYSKILRSITFSPVSNAFYVR